MFKRLKNLIESSATSAASPPLRNEPPVVEQRAVLLAGKHITYTLKRSKRRSIGLRIDDRGLTVSVPLRASEKWLNSVLQEKAKWVIEKLDGWQESRPAAPSWRDGEAMELLGELLVLRVMRSLFVTPPERRKGELWVFVTDDNQTDHIEHVVWRWYENHALELFEERVAHYAPLLNVAPRAVKLSAATAQWGSCTVEGVVRLNTQLIKLPLRLIDYVVVHELAHLREMNHSAAFWQVVESASPNYVRLRAELKAIAIR